MWMLEKRREKIHNISSFVHFPHNHKSHGSVEHENRRWGEITFENKKTFFIVGKSYMNKPVKLKGNFCAAY